MTNPHALAAGQGDDPSSPENSSQVPETPNAQRAPEDDGLESDESLRRRAASTMALHLESATNLIERCEYLALQPKGDRLRPLHAAARLLQADAKVAHTLGELAQVEQRRRTIIEHIQPPVPVLKDSNSNFENGEEGKLFDGLLLTMLRYMKLVADEKLEPALKEAAEDVRKEESSAPTAETGAVPA